MRRLHRLPRRRSAASSTAFRQGFFRFKPRRLASSSSSAAPNNNTWGLGFSEEGLLFGSTANGNPSVYMPIPNRYYEAVRGWSSTRAARASPATHRFYPITDKVRQVDCHGGFTAAAGHALYTARTYPQEYWNRTAFVTEPTGHLVGDVRAAAATAADFRSRNAWNLLASDDEWTVADHGRGRPRRQRLGDRLVQLHRPAQPDAAGLQDRQGQRLRDRPARQEARPHLPGRLHRTPSRPTPFIARRTPRREKLVAALKNDNLFWRLHAQRLLVERGKPGRGAGL